MNSPEYILVDVFGTKDADGFLNAGILYEVKTALSLPVLNYQYGTIEELEQTLQQWAGTNTYAEKKYPLVWLRQPYTVVRTKDPQFFGHVKGGLDIFIIESSNKDLKAYERMSTKFKPTIYPIYRMLLEKLNQDPAISYNLNRGHEFTDRYSNPILADIVDVSHISGLELMINNNPNCSPTFNLI